MGFFSILLDLKFKISIFGSTCACEIMRTVSVILHFIHLISKNSVSLWCTFRRKLVFALRILLVIALVLRE